MSQRTWVGGAMAVRRVKSFTPTAVAGETYTLTRNGKTVSYVASGAPTVTEIINGLISAVNLSADQEFKEVTWTNATTYLAGTGPAAGDFFDVTSSATGAATLVAAVVTAGTGPNYWTNTANWLEAIVPVTGDDVLIDRSVHAIKFGLNQSAVTLATLRIGKGQVGWIGLPANNGAGTTAYREDRDQYLKIGATSITVGFGEGAGSQLIKIDTGAAQTALNVLATGQAGGVEAGLEALQWKGTHASNVVNVASGSVGVAVLPGEVATAATLLSGGNDQGGNAAVRTGVLSTIGIVTLNSGTLQLASGCTGALVVNGGTLTVTGGNLSGTTQKVNGKLWFKGGGTIADLEVLSQGDADFSADPRTATCTARVDVHKGGRLWAPNGNLALAAGWATIQCDLPDVKVALGVHKTHTPSAGP